MRVVWAGTEGFSLPNSRLRSWQSIFQMMGVPSWTVRSNSWWEVRIAVKPSAVPGFVVFDQPSQAYFPRKLAARAEEAEAEPQLTDEDVAAVRKAFAVMGEVVAESKDSLQILVFDHAPESVWGGLANVVLVEEWRGGNKLVPEAWLS